MQDACMTSGLMLQKHHITLFSKATERMHGKYFYRKENYYAKSNAQY